MTHPRMLLPIILLILVMGSAARGESHVIGAVGERPLALELVVPAGDGPHPLLIWIHGGGWRGGDHLNMPGFTESALDAGFAVASLDYRLTSEAGLWGDAPVTWPAQLHDCKAGIRWLRANAGVQGLDPDRFVAWGHSAGGHLAAMIGTTADDPALEGEIGPHLGTSTRVAVAVTFSGPSNLLTMNDDVTVPPGSKIDHEAIDSPESRLIGSAVHGHSLGDIRDRIEEEQAPWPELVAAVRSASPVEQVDADDPVVIWIAHGARDRLVSLNQAVRLEQACLEHGVRHATDYHAQAGHGLPAAAFRTVLSWLPKTLSGAGAGHPDSTSDGRNRLAD